MTLNLDQVNRHRERARDERADLDAVLDAGHHVGTLSTVADGTPWVVPMLYGRAGDRILMHGSVGAGALRYVATGASAEVPFHTRKQLAATTALAMDIVEGQWTVKVRDAGPGEPEPGEATQGLW